jgi:hypothetical protein
MEIMETQVRKVLLRAKKVGHQISVSFEKFDVVQALLSFFYTIPADSLKIYFFVRHCQNLRIFSYVNGF